MILPITTLARAADDVDLADLTTAVRTGPATWTDTGLDLPLDRDLTATEEADVIRRLTTAGPVEEALQVAAQAALDTDRIFRDSTTTQLLAGAQSIIDDPTITQAEAITYVRQLATGVRSLTNQVNALSRQNIALIRLALRLLDATD